VGLGGERDDNVGDGASLAGRRAVHDLFQMESGYQSNTTNSPKATSYEVECAYVDVLVVADGDGVEKVVLAATKDGNATVGLLDGGGDDIDGV
jgi:hypothetical protein